MNLYYLSLCSLAGIIASFPVMVCQFYVNNGLHKYSKFFRLLLFILTITILWSLLTILYLYFIFNNVKMGEFFPIIKIIEIFVPIILSIIIYKETYNIYNYLGFISALIAIILISQISI